MRAPLSEGTVVLERGTNTPGSRVHRATRREFVTLYAVELASAEAQECADIHVHIGDRPAVRARLSRGKPSIVNMCVEGGEEVWVSCTVPRAYALYGVVS